MIYQDAFLVLASDFFELEADVSLEAELDSVVSALALLSLFGLPEFLKSVSYQPLPFRRKAAAVTHFFNAGWLQAGQSISLGSDIF
jgi:hypothetical protein